MALDDYRLEATLYYPQHLFALSHLDTKFAILAYLSLNLDLFLDDTLLVGFLAASHDLDYLHVFGENGDFDEVGLRSALPLGLVVTDQIDLLRTRTTRSLPLLLMHFLANADSAASLPPLPLLSVRDKYLRFQLISLPLWFLYVVFCS